MGVTSTRDPCTICFAQESIMHSHHTIPRSRGGDDSLQIILCPTCHNGLHAAAVDLISRINTSRRKKPKPAKQFWKDGEAIERAQPYLQILVQALLAPIPEGVTRQHLLSTSVETPIFEGMKMLQTDLGLPSMEKTLDYCIALALKHRGITNDDRKNNALADQWFIQR